MSEKRLSKRIMEALKGLDPVPVDNPRKPGTPDINYIEGWLELKYLPKWPSRPETIVRIKTWTNKQMVWHYTRTALGGKCFVLLQVGPEYLLFDGSTAAVFFNEVPRERMRQLAIIVWDKYPGDILCKYLK